MFIVHCSLFIVLIQLVYLKVNPVTQNLTFCHGTVGCSITLMEATVPHLLPEPVMH